MRYMISIWSALLLLGCGDAPKEEPVHNETQKVSTQTTSLQKTVAPPLVKHEASVDEAKEDVEARVIESVDESKAAVEKSAVAATEAVQQAAPVDGATIFQQCTSCHGQKAERPALGKSQIIAGWDASKVSEALHGYQDGSYGGAMKALMQAQVKTLSDEQIDAVAVYIESL